MRTHGLLPPTVDDAVADVDAGARRCISLAPVDTSAATLGVRPGPFNDLDGSGVR